MNQRKILLMPILGMFSLVMLISCGKDESKSEITSVLSINGAEVLTRSSKDTFVQGDQIGLFVTEKDGNKYNDCICSWNNKATLQVADWKLDNNIYLGSRTGTLHAYYPYSEGVFPTQLTVESAAQTDYLFSKAITVDAENPVVTLQMQHALSLVKLVIRKNGYLGGGHISGITFQGVSTEGTLDLFTGGLTSGKTGNESYKGEFMLGESPLAIGIIALPQEVTSTTVLVLLDGERYGYKLPEGIWEQGKEITYTLGINTVGKQLFQIGASTIDSWGAGGSYEGDLAPGIDIGTEID